MRLMRFNRRLLPMLVGCALLSAGSATVLSQPSAATTRPTPAGDEAITLDEQRQKDQKAWKLELAALPDQGTFEVRDVLTFSLKDGWLSIATPLPLGNDWRRVALRGRPDGAQMRVIDREMVRSLGPARCPQLTYHDFSVPNVVFVNTQVITMPDSIQLVQESETVDESMFSVTFMQKLGSDHDDGVWLRVTEIRADDAVPVPTAPMGPPGLKSSATQPAPPVNIKLAADNFVELRRKHPREVNLYLRPIFRTLDQESTIFGVDSKAAWQVLADSWKPDAALSAKVDALVKQMGADSYQDRQSAQEQLQKLGQPAAMYLMRAARTGWSDEQSTEVDAFLAPYRPLSAEEAARRHDDADFLLDCLYVDDQPLRAAAVARLREMTKLPIEFDLSVDGEARAEAIQKLWDQLAAKSSVEPSSHDRLPN
jgi:hypothetical protein